MIYKYSNRLAELYKDVLNDLKPFGDIVLCTAEKGSDEWFDTMCELPFIYRIDKYDMYTQYSILSMRFDEHGEMWFKAYNTENEKEIEVPQSSVSVLTLIDIYEYIGSMELNSMFK